MNFVEWAFGGLETFQISLAHHHETAYSCVQIKTTSKSCSRERANGYCLRRRTAKTFQAKLLSSLHFVYHDELGQIVSWKQSKFILGSSRLQQLVVDVATRPKNIEHKLDLVAITQLEDHCQSNS